MSALANRLRESFARELHADSVRQRGRLHDPSAARVVPRGFEKWERLARGEEAQRIVEIVRREKLWAKDSRLDQWVERIYCALIGMGSPVGAAAAIPLGPTDVLGGTGTVVGYLQAELGITIATGVSGWASQLGGTTLDGSQAGTTQQPTYAANNATIWGRSTVTGDGTNDVLNTNWNPPAPGTTPSWIRCVANRVTDIPNASLYAGTAASSMRVARNSTTTVEAFNGAISSAVTMSVATWYRTEALFANSALADYLKVGSGNTGIVAAFGNNDPASWRLFATSTAGANPGNYAIQRLLVLNAAPSTLQKALFDAIDLAFYNGNISL